MKLGLFIFPFVLNNESLPELLDSQEADEKLEKSKCGHFDMKVTLIHWMIIVHCL